MPEPPQQFRFPELLPNTGSVLLSADQITVKERVTCEVSFALSRGDRLVVTGPNGAGKSTLLSVLAGELHPSTGFVRRPPGIRLGFLRLEVRRARAELAEQFETELGKHPDGPILMSLPGVGCRTAVTMLVEISGIDRFPNAGHLAVYAGVAPRTHRSGTSIKGEHHRHGGNSRLKRAMYLSAFAALRDPLSRTYYDRKRAEGKNHRSALISLARRRSNVLYAMLSNGSKYTPTAQQAIPSDPATPCDAVRDAA